MPACSCPHCKTPHWVKDTQLNVAQGFVVCTRCSGMFKAKDYLSGNLPADPAHLPVAVTDVRLVHNIGAQILKHSKLSRKEISDLLNSALKEEPKAEVPKAAPAPASAPAVAAPAQKMPMHPELPAKHLFVEDITIGR